MQQKSRIQCILLFVLGGNSARILSPYETVSEGFLVFQTA